MRMEVIIGFAPGVPRIASQSAYAHKANVPISLARRDRRSIVTRKSRLQHHLSRSAHICRTAEWAAVRRVILCSQFQGRTPMGNLRIPIVRALGAASVCMLSWEACAQE